MEKRRHTLLQLQPENSHTQPHTHTHLLAWQVCKLKCMSIVGGCLNGETGTMLPPHPLYTHLPTSKLTNTLAHRHMPIEVTYTQRVLPGWNPTAFTFGPQFALANVSHILLGTLFIGCTHKFLSLHNPFTKLICQKFGKALAKWILSGSHI